MPKRSPPRGTVARKAQHVDLVLRKNVTFRSKSTGLEEWEFVHNFYTDLHIFYFREWVDHYRLLTAGASFRWRF